MQVRKSKPLSSFSTYPLSSISTPLPHPLNPQHIHHPRRFHHHTPLRPLPRTIPPMPKDCIRNRPNPPSRPIARSSRRIPHSHLPFLLHLNKPLDKIQPALHNLKNHRPVAALGGVATRESPALQRESLADEIGPVIDQRHNVAGNVVYPSLPTRSQGHFFHRCCQEVLLAVGRLLVEGSGDRV